MPRILLLQGANMSFLGYRQPEIYGRTTAKELDSMIEKYSQEKNFELEILYSNHEGVMIDKLLENHNAKHTAAVFNPGGFVYSGYAIRDCIRGIALPVIEVHMTNHYDRGIRSVIGEACSGIFLGLGIQMYFRAIDGALELVRQRSETGE